MNELILYILGYAGAAVLALALTPLAIQFAKTHNLYDLPDQRKVHSNPIPRFGGVAVYLASMIAAAAVGFCSHSGHCLLHPGAQEIPLFLGATLMFLVGLWDDIRSLTARQKLFIELVAALYLCGSGYQIRHIGFSGLEVEFPVWLSWGLSVFWIVGLTNAINLTDGLDGLVAGVSAITSCFLGILCFVFGDTGLGVFLLTLSGSLMGFLVFNANPARIFLGDCGSLFVGFVLAGTSLAVVHSGRLNHYLVLFLVFLIPVLDTLLIIIRRYLERRSIFSPDQGHFHHRLLQFGYRHQQAVLIIYGMTFTGVLLGLVVLRSAPWIGFLICLGLLAVVLFIFRCIGAFGFREMVKGFKQKIALGSQIRNEVSRYETIELSFQKADTLPQWWKAVCMAADRLHLSRLSLLPGTEGGSGPIRSWQNAGYPLQVDSSLSMTVPVYDRLKNKRYLLRVDLQPGTSYESSGRVLTLFARLIDKYGMIRYIEHESILIEEMLARKKNTPSADPVPDECLMV